MVDASIFAQPFQGGMGAPQSPEEYQDRYRQWMEILQNPQTQQYLHESGLARGLLAFGSRLAQNMGTGNPFMASLGNAMETGVGTYDQQHQQALANAMQIAKGQQGVYEKGLDYWNEQAKIGLEDQKNKMLEPLYREQAGMYSRSNRGTSEDSDPFKTAKNAFEHARNVLGSEATPEQVQVFAEYIMEEKRYPASDRDPHFRSWLDRKKGKTPPANNPSPPANNPPTASTPWADSVPSGSAIRQTILDSEKPIRDALYSAGDTIRQGAGSAMRAVGEGLQRAYDKVNPPERFRNTLIFLMASPNSGTREEWEYLKQNEHLMDAFQKQWFRRTYPPEYLP